MPLKKAKVTFKSDNKVNVEIEERNLWENNNRKVVKDSVDLIKKHGTQFLAQTIMKDTLYDTVDEYNNTVDKLKNNPTDETLQSDLLALKITLDYKIDAYNGEIKTASDYLQQDLIAYGIKDVVKNAQEAGLTTLEIEKLLADGLAGVYGMPAVPTSLWDAIDLLQTPEAEKYHGYSECFAAGTLILLPDGKTVPIEAVATNITVLSFPTEDTGTAIPLVPNKVLKIYHNVTQEFLRLSFADGRPPLIVTPGHRFFDDTAGFTKIAELVNPETQQATIVDVKGGIENVSVEWLRFNEETAHLFERSSERRIYVDGKCIDKENAPEGWKTYNLEIENYHTYVANGVRVHNDSGFLGHVGTILDDEFFDQLGTLGDGIGDIVTAPFHGIGEIVDGVLSAVGIIGDAFSDALGKFSQGDIIGGITDIGKGIGNGLSEIGKSVWDGVKDIGNAVWDGIKTVGKAISDAVDSVFGRNDGGGGDSGKPVIIDLDGDGIEVSVDAFVDFDMDGDGFLEQTSWAHADDGFLVIDLNADGSRGDGDGLINQTDELVLSNWLGFDGATDLQALAIFDEWEMHGGNNDGVLSAQDAIWSELRIWQDSNQNGITDDGELKTLNQLGISQINLQYDDGTHYSDLSNDIELYGNVLLGTASYTRNGEIIEGGVGDMSLSYQTEGWRQVETDTGYQIELENGDTENYQVLTNNGSANVAFYGSDLDGATGDSRNNTLNAMNYYNAVQLMGRGGDDILSGGNKDDILSGDAGSDQLRGFQGDDVLFFDALDTVIDGGQGTDTAYFADNTDLTFDLGSNQIEELHSGNGNDDLSAESSSSDVAIFAAGGNDIVTGGSGDDTLDGGSGNDTLDGNAGEDNISGGNGSDMITGGDGADTLIGGAGNDTLDGGENEDTLHGGTGSDVLRGGRGSDSYHFNRGDGSETIDDYGGDDDSIEFGADIDLRDIRLREDGNDLIIYILPEDNPTISLSEVTDIIRVKDWTRAKGQIEVINFASGLSVSLWELDNLFDVSLQSIPQPLGHHSGTNLHDWIEGADSYNSIVAGAGNDIVFGGNHMNSLNGNSGNDVIYGGDDIDGLSGGDGQDRLFGGAGNDALVGNNGHDVLFGEQGDDRLEGDDGNDALTGGTGDDTLIGGAGNDAYYFNRGDGKDIIDDQANSFDVVIFGGLIDMQDLKIVKNGSDLLIYILPKNNPEIPLNLVTDVLTIKSGSINALQFSSGLIIPLESDATTIISAENVAANREIWKLIYGTDENFVTNGTNGTDWIEGDNANNTIRSGLGSDVIQTKEGDDDLFGDDGHDIIFAGEGDDRLNGGLGDDSLYAGDGDDNLYGGYGNDVLDGGNGNDLLSGGFGNDILTGGAGNDTFNFTHTSFGHDVITDVQVGDAVEDIIEFNTSTFQNFNAVIDASQDVGSDMVILLDDNSTITLLGVSVDDLSADDFRFT